MPTTAEEILGWSETYAQAIDAGCRAGWSHAYLIESEHAQGAAFYARALARAVNCEGMAPPEAPVQRARTKKSKKGDAPPTLELPQESVRILKPCGHCEPCRRTAAGSFPPVQEIWPVGLGISIDQVHEMIAQVANRMGPTQTKVFVLHSAEQMQTPAASALLKTLEEPPPRTVFVLATASSRELLATIRSRCRLVRLGLPNDADLVGRLNLDPAATPPLLLGMEVAGRHPEALLELQAHAKELSSWAPPADFATLTDLSKKAIRAAQKDPAGLTAVHSVLWGGWYGLNLLGVLARILGQLVNLGGGVPNPLQRVTALVASRGLLELQDLLVKEAEKATAAKLAALQEQFGDAYVHPQLAQVKMSYTIGRLHATLVLRALTVALRDASRPTPSSLGLPALDSTSIARMLRHLDVMRMYLRQNVNVGMVFDELFLGLSSTVPSGAIADGADGQAEAEVA
jgi:hypothetical protein